MAASSSQATRPMKTTVARPILRLLAANGSLVLGEFVIDMFPPFAEAGKLGLYLPEDGSAGTYPASRNRVDDLVPVHGVRTLPAWCLLYH